MSTARTILENHASRTDIFNACKRLGERDERRIRGEVSVMWLFRDGSAILVDDETDAIHAFDDWVATAYNL